MGSITINGKQVKNWVIGGKTVKSLEMGGKVLSLIQVQTPTSHNSFKGTFSTPAKQADFMAVTTTIASRQFVNEPKITSVSLPDVTDIGPVGLYFSPLTFVYIPKATTIGFNSFFTVVNAASTVVTMNKKFNTDTEKDRIFGKGHWSNITFHWLNDDGTPWVDPNTIWHYGDGSGGPHPTKNDWKGTFSDPSVQSKYEAITSNMGFSANMRNEINLVAVSLPRILHVDNDAFKNSPLKELYLPVAETIGNRAFYNAPLTYIYAPKAIVQQFAFASTVNSQSTTAILYHSLNNNSDKDNIFDIGQWNNITFQWV